MPVPKYMPRRAGLLRDAGCFSKAAQMLAQGWTADDPLGHWSLVYDRNFLLLAILLATHTRLVHSPGRHGFDALVAAALGSDEVA